MTIIMETGIGSWENQFLSQINLLSAHVCVCVLARMDFQYIISIYLWKYAFVKSDGEIGRAHV